MTHAARWIAFGTVPLLWATQGAYGPPASGQDRPGWETLTVISRVDFRKTGPESYEAKVILTPNLSGIGGGVWLGLSVKQADGTQNELEPQYVTVGSGFTLDGRKVEITRTFTFAARGDLAGAQYRVCLWRMKVPKAQCRGVAEDGFKQRPCAYCVKSGFHLEGRGSDTGWKALALGAAPATEQDRSNRARGADVSARERIYERLSELLTTEGWASQAIRPLEIYAQKWQPELCDPLGVLRSALEDLVIPEQVGSARSAYETAQTILEQIRTIAQVLQATEIQWAVVDTQQSPSEILRREEFREAARLVNAGKRDEARQRLQALRSKLSSWKAYVATRQTFTMTQDAKRVQQIKDFLSRQIDAALAFLQAEVVVVSQSRTGGMSPGAARR